MEIPIIVQNVPLNIDDMMAQIQEQQRRCSEQVRATMNMNTFPGVAPFPNMQFQFGGQYPNMNTNAYAEPNGNNWAHAEAFASTNGHDSRQSATAFNGDAKAMNQEPEETDTRATTTNDAQGFTVTLDVHNYKPSELSVKVVDKHIVVEGKCEQHQTGDGVVARHFVRKYIIPENCDKERVTSSLSTDGKLIVKVPAKQSASTPSNERVIHIQRTT